MAQQAFSQSFFPRGFCRGLVCSIKCSRTISRKLYCFQQFKGFLSPSSQHSYLAVQVGGLVGQPHRIGDRGNQPRKRDASENQHPDHGSRCYPL